MCLEKNIFSIVNRFADPTDRPFDCPSSPDHGGAVENAHDTAALGNETDQKIGKVHPTMHHHFSFL